MIPVLLFGEISWFYIAKKEINWWMLMAAVAGGLATLANPHGPYEWWYSIKAMFTASYRNNIAEWAPYCFAGGLEVTFLISMFAIGLAAGQQRFKTLEFVRALAIWLLALYSRMYTPYAALSSAVLLGTLDTRDKPAIKPARVKIFACLILASFLAMALRGAPSTLDAAARTEGYPVDAVTYISKNHVQKIYNPYGWGGYLIWKDMPVYVDGRADVYAYKNILKNDFNLCDSEAPIGQVIADTGAESVLTQSNDVCDQSLKESPEWKEVYRDKNAAVYIRNHDEK